MARRGRRAGLRALWAPVPVDVTTDQVHPIPGWVVLKELFVNHEHAIEGTDVVLTIARPFERNTMHGEVLAIHPITSKELNTKVGDMVVYKEYSGGRWSFNGDAALITPAEDILAHVQ